MAIDMIWSEIELYHTKSVVMTEYALDCLTTMSTRPLSRSQPSSPVDMHSMRRTGPSSSFGLFPDIFLLKDSKSERSVKMATRFT